MATPNLSVPICIGINVDEAKLWTIYFSLPANTSGSRCNVLTQRERLNNAKTMPSRDRNI